MSRNEVCALTGTDPSEPAALKRFQKNWDGAEEITMHHACQEAQRYLTSCKIADAAVDAWYLLEYVTGVSRARYLADRDKRLSKEQWDAYAALIEKRGAHIPLQHLTGEQEFMGLPFLVNGDVLIPRQDTELLVEMALETLKTLPRDGKGDLSGIYPYRVLDLCTGSGCIAISIAKMLEPWRSRKQSEKTDGMPVEKTCAELAESPAEKADGIEIYASDISEAALKVARENAGRLGADVYLIQSDLFDGFTRECWREDNEEAKNRIKDCVEETAKGSAGDSVNNNEKDSAGDIVRGSVPARFDMIVSNPPYIRTAVIEELDEEVRMHEPHLALDGGEDGLALYRRIIRESVNWLKSDGWLLLEIGYDQGETVPELMRRYGFSRVRVAKDLAGLDRVVCGQRCGEEVVSGRCGICKEE